MLPPLKISIISLSWSMWLTLIPQEMIFLPGFLEPLYCNNQRPLWFRGKVWAFTECHLVPLSHPLIVSDHSFPDSLRDRELVNRSIYPCYVVFSRYQIIQWHDSLQPITATTCLVVSNHMSLLSGQNVNFAKLFISLHCATAIFNLVLAPI